MVIVQILYGKISSGEGLFASRSWLHYIIEAKTVPRTIDPTQTLEDINEERCIRRRGSVQPKSTLRYVNFAAGRRAQQKNHVIIVRRRVTNILPETIHLLFTTITHILLAQTLRLTKSIILMCFINMTCIQPYIYIYIQASIICMTILYQETVVLSVNRCF